MMLDPDVAPPLSSNLWLRVAHAISEATPQSAFACLLALGWCLTVSAFLRWFRRAQVRTKRAPQTPKESTLDSRARGCMLGAAVGDALGAGCEMMTRDLIATTYGRVEAYIPTSLQKFGGENQRIPGCYTDDTEMALGLALSLTEMRGDVDTASVAAHHMRLYSPWRGYGRGTTAVLQALIAGEASPLTCGLELTRPTYAPKATWQGSKSNGGAMRIHPLGLLAAAAGAEDEDVRRATAAALLPTHTHTEGIDAACIQAAAVSRLCRRSAAGLRVGPLLEELASLAQTGAMRAKLQTLRSGIEAGLSEEHLVDNEEDGLLGLDGVHGVEAVACALCCLAFHAHEPAEGLVAAVGYGGDCDTIAGMAGALLGALHGAPEAWMPKAWVAGFEPAGHGGYSWDAMARVGRELVAVGRLRVEV